MLVYWVLFCVFAAGALVETPYKHFGLQRKGGSPFLFATILLALLIAFRFEVGGDWGSYLRLYRLFSYSSVTRAVELGDPAYNLLNIGASAIGAGIWLVNLVCASIFSWGLYRFAKGQPSPWLTVVVAIPYLVIVVAMGYTRQAVAIGILMAGMASFQKNGSVIRFAVYVFAAALFHRTAVVALPLVAIGTPRNAVVNLLIAAGITSTLYDSLVSPEIDRLVRNYAHTELNSQGAAIRIAMSVIPAVIFFAARKGLGFSPRESALWRNFSLASLVAVVALPMLTTTLVDRLALYLLPLQLAVLPRISAVLSPSKTGTLIVTAYAFAVQFAWLNYATNAHYWVPYKFYQFSS